jgi:hypothetical protein
MIDDIMTRQTVHDWHKYLAADERREIANLDRIIKGFIVPPVVVAARKRRRRLQNTASARASRNGGK